MRFKFTITTLCMLLSFAFLQAQSYVQIGSGDVSTSYPVYGYYNYAWYSSIYEQVDLGGAKQITQIAFDCTNGPKTNANQKIYIKHTSNDIFASSAYENPESNGYTLVFDGDITFDGWTVITLDTPFDYNGSDNIIVHYENRDGNYDYESFNSTASTTHNNKSAGSDETFPTSAGNLNPYPSSLPNIRFYYASNGPGTPTNPNPAENAIYVDAETLLEFDLDENTATYDVYFSADEASVINQEAAALITDDAVASGAGTYNADPSTELLDSKTTYYWQVVANNGTETSTSPVWAFEVQKIISQFPYDQNFEGTSDVVFPIIYAPDESDWNWTTGTGSWNSRGSYAQNGDSCAYISPSFLDENTNYELVTPRFNLPENMQISFWWFNGDSIPGEKIANVDSCYFQVTSDGGTTWTTLARLAPAEAQEQYVQEVADLTSYAGNNTYLRWVYKIIDAASYPKPVFLDNIEIKASSSGAEITLNPTTLAFGDIYTGGYYEMPVAISNGNANQALTITNVNTPDGYTCNYSGTIAGGTSDTAIISFEPATAGTFNGDVTFNIDGNFSGENSVSVSGNGLEPLTEIFEYFDNTEVNSLPENWNKIDNPDNAYHFAKVVSALSYEYNSAPNVLRLYNASDYTHPLMAIMPGLTDFDTNILEFYAIKSAQDSLDLFVGVMDNPKDPTTFSATDTIQITQELTKYSISFDAANTKPYIAFAHGLNDSVTSSIRIDDVVWKNPNNSGLPNAAGNIYPIDNNTNVDIMNTIPFRWSNEGGEPTGYRFSMGSSSEAFEIVNNVDAGNLTQFNFSDELEYNTTYFWKVVPYNENGDAENVEIWSFTTMPDPTISAYPWSENFNNYTTHFLPDGEPRYPMGWSLETNNTAWDKLANNATFPNNANSDSIAMHVINFDFSNPLDDWLFTPPMQMQAGNDYHISFWYKAIDFVGDGTFEKMEVKIGNAHTGTAMTEEIFFDNNITPADYREYTTIFSPSTSGAFYIGFHAMSDPMQGILAIDDVSVDEEVGITTNETTEPTLKVYPNPGKGVFQIKGRGAYKVEVLNAIGKIVIRKQMLDATSIDLTGYSKGLYIINLKTGDNTYSRRIILN